MFMLVAGSSHTMLLLTTVLQRKMMQVLHVKCQLFCTALFIVSEKVLQNRTAAVIFTDLLGRLSAVPFP